MKISKKLAVIATLFSIMTVASGCKPKTENTPTGVGAPGYPGYNAYGYGIGVQPTGNGGSLISFNGTSVFNNGTEASGGQVVASPYGVGNVCGQPKFCANTNYGMACKEFFNACAGRLSGTVTTGVGQPGSNLVTIQSMYFPGSSIAVAHTPMYGTQANVNGQITLSAQVIQQIQAQPPAGWPNIIGVAYDIYSSGGGGVLVYTSPGHGFFLPL